MFNTKLIEVTTDKTTDKLTVNVCKYEGSSSDAVSLVQLLTDTEVEPDGGFRGFLGGTIWLRPRLSGENHTLRVRGTRDEIPIELVVHKMSAGFMGSGPLDAVAILVHLDLGTEDYLRRIITTKDPDANPHDTWKVEFGPDVLTPHADFR